MQQGRELWASRDTHQTEGPKEALDGGMQRTMGKPHGHGDFVGDQKEGTESSERRKMLEREQIINGTRTRCWGSRGWREERVVLLFFFSHLHKTCFHTDLALLKNQHLEYHLLPTWNGTGKPQ